MTDTAPAYRVRTAHTWEQARDAYLDGETAESVCRRFGLGLSAFRRRARIDGWRREDQDDPDPVALDAERDAPDQDFVLMAKAAKQRLTLALLDGRAAEALRWLRLFDTLSARVETEHQPSDAATDTTSPDTAEVHELHELHPVFSESEPSSPSPAAAPAPALNRAERRRLRHDQRHDQCHDDLGRRSSA